jgi:hypothetical protein
MQPGRRPSRLAPRRDAPWSAHLQRQWLRHCTGVTVIGHCCRFQIVDTPSQSRGSIRPSFASSPHPLNQEGAGKAGCRLAPTVRCAKAHAEKLHSGIQVQPKHSAFPAQWVDGLCRALPGAEFLLASLAPRIDDAVRPVGLANISATGLTVATTARTTRFCRTRVHRSPQGLSAVCTRAERMLARRTFSAVRLHVAEAHRDYPPCPTSRARRCRVHRNPARET